MEQDRNPRYKPTHLWVPYFFKSSIQSLSHVQLFATPWTAARQASLSIRGKNIKWSKDNLFNMCCWGNWTATYKRVKLEHFLTQHIRISSKWIKDWNVRPETIKLLEENIVRTLYDINHSKILYDPPPRVMEIKAKKPSRT